MRLKNLSPYWPFAVIILLVFLFFFNLAFSRLILARGDTHAYFYPYWDARDTALANGDLPLWTSELFMGAPLLANPQLGTLYPPNWLTIPLNAPDSIKVSILLHVGWAILGAYTLAKRQLCLDVVPALTAGILFGLGGYLNAHVEQINQLQALAWMPWLFLLFELAIERPWRYMPLLGAAWAMQLLAGHTQVVFITGVGLGVYGISNTCTFRRGDLLWSSAALQRLQKTIRPLLLLAIAAFIAVMLALPQLLPTQHLISLSNRGGGLSQHEATAFSLDPLLLGRGLLPSYDGQPFAEFIGYIGVIGLGLAAVGAWSDDKKRWVWLVLGAAGLFLAFGRHNPGYWQMARLPGFNLFRVPARWLALFALSASMLGGMGIQVLLSNRKDDSNGVGAARTTITILFIVGLLAAGSLLSDRAPEDVYGPKNPTSTTFIGWGIALVAFLALVWWKARSAMVGKRPMRAGYILFPLVIVELWVASFTLPYNDLVDPAIYNDARFPIYQMQVYGQDEVPAGRMLAITDFRFFPGDEAVLMARWEQMGLSDRAIEHAFTALKRQETIVANMPLTWGIPSIDGFGGGVLPTEYYTAFTSLLLPEGTLRTIDGRLRQVLATEACRGACIPDDVWLDLTNTQYLITDKVYDRVHEGIFYDMQFNFPVQPWETYRLDTLPHFVANSIHILYTGDALPQVTWRDEEFHTEVLQLADGEEPVVDGYKRAILESVEAIAPTVIKLDLQANTDIDIRAITLVDDRTGDFIFVTPHNWQRIFSGDIKIYKNLDVLPRAFVVHSAVLVADSWDGTERALEIMQLANFDPAKTMVLNSNAPEPANYAIGRHREQEAEPVTTIVEHTATRVEIAIEAGAPGYLVLTDAYSPEWRATVNGEDADIYRADVMFRAVQIPRGQSTVIFEYQNRSFKIGLVVMAAFAMLGGVVWWWKGWRDHAE